MMRFQIKTHRLVGSNVLFNISHACNKPCIVTKRNQL